ncbi:MAG: replication-associated recombination protein A [Candidatus Omnitrophica bacterium]|nr:replication-associated recombination protein A [Candidatus Omnitrophota bacterium]
MKAEKKQDPTELFTPPAAEEPQDAQPSNFNEPLASRMRPQTLEEVTGQEHILAPGKLLWRTIQADRFSSLIFYGPPGSGKTSLATVISKAVHSYFLEVNAVSSNVTELRRLLEEARQRQRAGQRVLIFIDEIHRFNKAQQDVLMPDLERGVFVLIGATTHNPSFAINGPLLSRAMVFELRPLENDALIRLLERAITDPERGLGKLKIQTDPEALVHIAKSSGGDARRALGSLERAALTTESVDGTIHITAAVAEESCQRKVVYHDRAGDYHYDLASAFIKSLRGSDVDASLYWLAKMLTGGEEMRFILRRMMIFASEDIGNAEPQALILTASALQACEMVGLPEAQIILGQIVTYLALAPKSNASYMALNAALDDIKNETLEEVPNPLRDKHYAGAQRLKHGEGYKYTHDYQDKDAVQDFRKSTKRYYQPTARGYEKILQERLKYWHELKKTSKDS